MSLADSVKIEKDVMVFLLRGEWTEDEASHLVTEAVWSGDVLRNVNIATVF